MKAWLNDKLLQPLKEFYADDKRTTLNKFMWTGFVIMFVWLVVWGLLPPA